MMIAMLGMVAFALDMGILLVARTELQRAADSAALAAAWELADDAPSYELEHRARNAAEHFAGLNGVLSSGPSVDRNESNSPGGDVVLGTLDEIGGPSGILYTGYPDRYNAVRVRIRRTAEINDEVPFFFARLFGINGRPTEATATAAIIKRIEGFRTPGSGESLPILPITIHEDAWNEAIEGGAAVDAWAYSDSDGAVGPGQDGMPEVLLYPERNGSPGNFGTVDIGPASNSTSHLSDQISNGISEADLLHHGGELKLDSAGELLLGGDSGMSTGIADDLAAIVGQKRIVPVYREVSKSGNNAVYTIVRFVGVRIMEVDLRGNNKAVYVQPANVFVRGAIQSPREETSDYVYSPAVLTH